MSKGYSILNICGGIGLCSFLILLICLSIYYILNKKSAIRESYKNKSKKSKSNEPNLADIFNEYVPILRNAADISTAALKYELKVLDDRLDNACDTNEAIKGKQYLHKPIDVINGNMTVLNTISNYKGLQLLNQHYSSSPKEMHEKLRKVDQLLDPCLASVYAADEEERCDELGPGSFLGAVRGGI
tara:strand:+ start:5624 stop:6181 length:558 start_codon:yes stop_codon:yes gene_type:complete